MGFVKRTKAEAYEAVKLVKSSFDQVRGKPELVQVKEDASPKPPADPDPDKPEND